ncbi:hypothetical protein CISIN_1g035206mg [Citrus sinensis]|uniref:Uncharacterized protein n=1 Tax=Citrus sinensis TaxID=2711 RepID=A0A067D073_CITSI|nr:hypothetical protein CISIN_1g035206mg [Citrus sinensis]
MHKGGRRGVACCRFRKALYYEQQNSFVYYPLIYKQKIHINLCPNAFHFFDLLLILSLYTDTKSTVSCLTS